jgi:ABC-type spermidine/putrescine transport system permease subunit II
MEDVGIFYGHLVYFTAIWYTLWTYGIFCGNLVYFSPFCYVVPGTTLATLSTVRKKKYEE